MCRSEQHVNLSMSCGPFLSSSFCFATCVCLSASDMVRALWRLENPALEAPKWTLWGLKIQSRSPQGGPGAPKSAQELSKSGPRAAQERPKSAQERQERLKSSPRAPQERPRGSQSSPMSPPKTSRGGLGDHFDTQELEKSDFRRRSVAQLG